MSESLQNQPISAADQPRAARPQFWKYLLTVLVTVFVTTALVLSCVLMYSRIKSTAQSDNVMTFGADAETAMALNKLKEAYKILDEQYYEDITDAQMLEAMTSGLVDEIGSRYTFYLTAEENQQLTESMSGQYVGIGATVSMNKSGMVEITEVIEGSPAEAAGVRVGDEFIEVNGEDVTSADTIDEVASLVRGEAGTTVSLVIYRPSEFKNINITATRQQITTVSVKGKMLSENIGYIQIREFSTGVSIQFKAAIEALEAQGATSIVFDMRNNSGGFATEVIDMLDYLLPEATIATIKGREKGISYEHSWVSQASMFVPQDMRYAVLMNGMTASAAELFSGCLHDYDLAYLIGEQSFGKGSGTKTYNLTDGSAINVTNFLYYLPNGDCIEEVGLTPDLPVELPDETAGMSIYQLTLEQDTQLTAAVNYLENLD